MTTPTQLQQLARETAEPFIMRVWGNSTDYVGVDRERQKLVKAILSALEQVSREERKELSGHEFYTSPLETEGGSASEGALDRGQKQHAGDEILSKSYGSVAALMRGEGIPQAVQDKVDELREADHVETLKQLADIRKEAEALATALAFYAAEENYHGTVPQDQGMASAVELDMGAEARAALAAWKEKQP